MGEKRLTLVAQPQAFFHELISEALGHQRISVQAETEFYLVNLLNQFMTTDRLYARDGNGAVREEPLALMVKEALEQSEPRMQSLLFRHIGDLSLYTAGFFQDSLSRKLVDVDYYIGMGETAYRHVAVRTDEKPHRTTYQELAGRFATFVEILAEVADKTAQRTEKDLLRLYDRWVRTGSERAAKALQEAGIIANDPAPGKPGGKKPLQ